MATQSTILAWRIPRAEESGGLPSIASQRVGDNRSDLACMHAYIKWFTLLYDRNKLSTVNQLYSNIFFKKITIVYLSSFMPLSSPSPLSSSSYHMINIITITLTTTIIKPAFSSWLWSPSLHHHYIISSRWPPSPSPPPSSNHRYHHGRDHHHYIIIISYHQDHHHYHPHSPSLGHWSKWH